MDCGSTILIFLAFIQATCGQSVTLTGPSAVQQGSNTVYICTGGALPYNFIWSDVDTGVNIFAGGEPLYDPMVYPKYVNFNVSENEGTSTMTIGNTLIEDEGQYRCQEGQGNIDDAELTVEVKPALNLSVESTIVSNIDVYVATCEALDGRPEVTITWMLGDDALSCDPLDEMSPTAGPGLFSKRSVCTFQATIDNYNKTLKCVITGHQLDDLNGAETTTLDMHSFPGADIITVRIQILDNSNVRVSCDIDDTNQTDPRIRNYYIYSDSTLIHQSSTGVNFVEVLESEYDPMNSEFNCVAGNYLGNATTFPPPSTTTLIPTTTAEPMTTEGNTTGTPEGLPSNQPPTPETGVTSITTTTTTTKETTEPPVKVAAIVGGVVGAIVVIVIIVIAVCYCKKEERFCFEAGGAKSSGSSKPAGSAVGSSNGSERDVESPLNGVKDVTAEEKTKPEAAPRGHGSIQHTNDNPNQDMYAMVDKKPSTGRGGDAPDRGSGPGQNEPQGMLYADLDLSHKAGHTDKHVPKNENDVVVYSSILV